MKRRARHGLVVGHQPEQHEARADGRLGQDEDDRERRGAPHRVAGGPIPEDAVREIEDEEQREPARQAMRELDERRDGRRARHDLAVAERPVRAAAGSRAEARTKAPHRITATFQPRVSQASRGSRIGEPRQLKGTTAAFNRLDAQERRITCRVRGSAPLTWNQIYDPLGFWPLSTLVAALPVLTLFFVLLGAAQARVGLGALRDDGGGRAAAVVFGMPAA
jgi:hypothetical protein